MNCYKVKVYILNFLNLHPNKMKWLQHTNDNSVIIGKYTTRNYHPSHDSSYTGTIHNTVTKKDSKSLEMYN